MRIAYILSSLANSGPIVVALDLVREMLKNQQDVEVFYFDNKKELEFPCPTHQISIRNRFPFHKFDIIHCHGLRPDLYIMLHKPIFCKTPICSTIHSYMFEDHAYKYGKWQSKITGRLVLASTFRDDKIILLSRHMQHYYEKYLPTHKLTHAYNTTTCDKSLPLTNSERDELLAFKNNDVLLCSVSGLNQRKGLHQIIQALPLLPNFRYCIVGDGNKREYLKNLATEFGVADRVLFVGAKPAGYRYLQYADIFVMPSYSEGFPLAMLEAAAMRKVVACSDIPVFREIFSKDEIAMFQLDNPESLKDTLLKAQEERETFSTNIYQRFIHEYSPACFYNRHLSKYEQIIANKRYHIQ